VLTLGSKERFQKSRDVGCYLGLRPRRSQSGDRDPQLGITKAGNVYLEVCSSSARTTSSDLMAETRRFDSGDYIWLSRWQAGQEQGCRRGRA
jgi:transposase